MPKGQRADGTPTGGSKSGGSQGAALRELRALPVGQTSISSRASGPESAMRWWAGLTPAARGDLIARAYPVAVEEARSAYEEARNRVSELQSAGAGAEALNEALRAERATQDEWKKIT